MSLTNKLNEINNFSSHTLHIALRNDEFDLLSNDKKTINTKKVIFALWNNRENSETIIELVDFLRYIL